MPKRLTTHPTEWPNDVGRFWIQAHRSLADENWDVAAVMARSALQLALRYQNASGANLKQEIDDLAGKGVLPPLMRAWAHELRELDSAHPKRLKDVTDAEDARDVVKFLDFALDYLYTIPHQIKQFRGRRSQP